MRDECRFAVFIAHASGLATGVSTSDLEAMDPRAEALYHESNEYVGGDHPLSRITRVEAETAVQALDRDSPGWDETLFIQDHVPAPDFGLDGLSLNPRVMTETFAPAVITLYPNRSRLSQAPVGTEQAVPAMAAAKSQRRQRPSVGSTSTSTSTAPRLVLDRIKQILGRLLGR